MSPLLGRGVHAMELVGCGCAPLTLLLTANSAVPRRGSASSLSATVTPRRFAVMAAATCRVAEGNHTHHTPLAKHSRPLLHHRHPEPDDWPLAAAGRCQRLFAGVARLYCERGSEHNLSILFMQQFKSAAPGTCDGPPRHSCQHSAARLSRLCGSRATAGRG